MYVCFQVLLVRQIWVFLSFMQILYKVGGGGDYVGNSKEQSKVWSVFFAAIFTLISIQDAEKAAQILGIFESSGR